jgi:hypothetical protein
LSKKSHGERGDHGSKEEKALWKKGSAYLTTNLIRVIPVFPVVGPLLFQLKTGIKKTA